MGKRKKKDGDPDAPPTATRTIKDSFTKCFKPERAPIVEAIVVRVHRIVRRGYEFAKTYLLALVEGGEALPVVFDRHFFQCVFATIAPPRNKVGATTAATAALRARMRAVREATDFSIDARDTTSGLSQVLCFSADKMEAAYALTISTNYASYLRRVAQAAYAQPDAGHLLDCSSKERYASGIDRVVAALMRGVRDDASYAPLLRAHIDSLVPPGVDFVTPHPKTKTARTASYWLEVPEVQPRFVRCAIAMMRLIEHVGRRAHYNVLPLAESLIPGYVRLDTRALIDFMTNEDIASLGLGVVRSDLLSNVCFFEDLIWERWVRVERRPFKRFDHTLETDAHGVSIQVALLEKSSAGDAVRPVKEPVEAYMGRRRAGDARGLVTIDPGKSDLIYAVGEHDVRFRYSQAQRDHECGFAKRQVKEQKLKARALGSGGAALVGGAVPGGEGALGARSPEQIEKALTEHDKRTCDAARWRAYLDARRAADVELEGFYAQRDWRQRRWRAEINAQRSMSKMVSAFAAKLGTANEVVIAFGDWSHTALRNQPPTMSIGIRRALRALGKYDVLMVNEYRTSKACSKACGGTCERFRWREKDGDPRSSLVWGLTRCTTCGELWNRDHNGARNIRLAALAALDGDERPAHLRRQPTTTPCLG